MSYHSLRKALGNCVKNVDQGFTNRVNSKGEPAKKPVFSPAETI